MGKRDKKERKNAVPRSPLKEFGAARGPGFCSQCKIFTSQQTTFSLQPVLRLPLVRTFQQTTLVQRLVMLIWQSKALIKSGYLKINSGYLTPAFLGARNWAEMLPNPCILGGP